MSIELHPDAARRLDELANQLLGKIAPAAPHAVRGNKFQPNVYPVAHIRSQDIIGSIRQTTAIVDGTGEEVGRLFEGDQINLGLLGESFTALTNLAIRVQAAGNLKRTTTLEYVRNVAFEWIEQKHKNTTSESFSTYVLKKAEEAIREFEIWIPVHRTYLESSIAIGPVMFQTITADMFTKWYAKAEERIVGSTAEEKGAIRVALARERSQLQSCAAVVTKITAEETKALLVAHEQAEHATALLRFLSPANWTPKRRSFCTPLGIENVRGRSELIVDRGSIIKSHRGALDSQELFWTLTNESLVHSRSVLQHLSSLAESPAKTPFCQNLYDALLMYSRNSIAADPADKLVYIIVALESMLLRNENEPIGKNVSERMAFLIGDSLETRKSVLANVAETYRLRSSFIHHGNSIADLKTLSTFMLNAWTCFYNLLFSIDRFQTKDELIVALEDRKMS